MGIAAGSVKSRPPADTGRQNAGFLCGERQHRIGGEPVLAGVIIFQVRQTLIDVCIRVRQRDVRARIFARQNTREPPPAPRAAEIETVEMAELGVGMVENRDGFEQNIGLPRG